MSSFGKVNKYEDILNCYTLFPKVPDDDADADADEYRRDQEEEFLFPIKYKYENMEPLTKQFLDLLFQDTKKPVLLFSEESDIDRFHGEYVSDLHLKVWFLDLASGFIEHHSYICEDGQRKYTREKHSIFENEKAELHEELKYMVCSVYDQQENDFEDRWQEDYPEDINTDDYIVNMDVAELSFPGKLEHDYIKEALEETDEIFFVSEKQDTGASDLLGPLEYFWTLYIFIKKADGTIVKRKFYREYYFNPYEEMDDVFYNEIEFNDSDSRLKFRHTLL